MPAFPEDHKGPYTATGALTSLRARTDGGAFVASAARYATVASLWVITILLAVVTDRAPRRAGGNILPIATAAAAAATAAVLTDELRRRSDDDHVTESCLAAIRIDRAGEGRRARRPATLRSAERPGRLHGAPAAGGLLATQGCGYSAEVGRGLAKGLWADAVALQLANRFRVVARLWVVR
jgi:hypothetical protein